MYTSYFISLMLSAAVLCTLIHSEVAQGNIPLTFYKTVIIFELPFVDLEKVLRCARCFDS